MQNLIHRLTARLILLALFCPVFARAAGTAEHVVLIVWDGMRPDFISAEHTPNLYRLAHDGVRFDNHHSAYCSATEVNGVAMATGSYPENSGVIANTMYLPQIDPLKGVAVENADAIRKGDQLTGGHYLLRPTFVEILQTAGRSTVLATAKQVGRLFDRRQRTNDSSKGLNLIDGRVAPASAAASIRAQLGEFPPAVPARSTVPNEPRDLWTTRALLGPLWSNGVPAFSLLWLSEPDASQHATGPGSPRSLAALESSDRKLAQVLAELDRRNIRDQTDVFVVSDHGFSTVETEVDVAKVLRDAGFTAQRDFKSGPKKGDILVVSQGGSVLFYVGEHHKDTTARLVDFLQQQSFAGVVLTRKSMPGTFKLDRATINSAAAPDVVLSMRWSTNTSAIGVPGMFATDRGRRPGEGNHASLSRFDLHNILVGAGPDLKKGFIDTLPSGNIDLAPTILWLLGVKSDSPMDGRVLSEALAVKAPRVGKTDTRRYEVTRTFEKAVWTQYLQISRVNDTIYLDEGNGGLRAK